MEKGTTYNREKTMCISDTGIIELESMSFWSHHGCLESERKKGNLFLVDFKGEMDLRAAAESDDLKDTVNYGEIHRIVKTEMAADTHLRKVRFWMRLRSCIRAVGITQRASIVVEEG